MKPVCESHDYLSTHRPIYVISMIIKNLPPKGISADSILHGSGVSVDDLDNPHKYIKPDQELRIVKRIFESTSDPECGLKLGLHIHIGTHGILGITAMLADTFLNSMKVLMRYSDLGTTFFHYQLFIEGNLAYLKMKELIDLKTLRQFICEMEFVAIYRMAIDVMGISFPLKEIHFAYAEPAHGSLYGKYFNCPVIFNSPDHMYVFDKKILQLPLDKINPLAKKAYEEECRKLSMHLKKHVTVTDQVYNEILFNEESHGSMEKMASRLGMSTRTLRRQLAQEGTTFQDIISDILKKKAFDLLTTTSLPIEEIAAQLGYSDAANFYHAFKKWTGMSPVEYRKNTQR